MKIEKWRKFLAENIDVDIEVGDIVLGGRYKNKRIEVKEIGTDEIGQPTINGRPMLKFRIEKHLPDDKKSKKTLDAEKSLPEGRDRDYYTIDPKNPPPIKDVLEDWIDGKKAYDAGSLITGGDLPYHGFYSVDDLWSIREYDWNSEKHRGDQEEWDTLVASIKKGFNPKYPVMVMLGKNGVAKIGEGNHRISIAKQLGIKMVPVNFIFQYEVHFDRNSFQVKDEDNEEAIEALADDSPEQIKTAEKELSKEKNKYDEWDDSTQELYDMITSMM
jgi:hypothetical protein